jgi:hypothetical protein
MIKVAGKDFRQLKIASVYFSKKINNYAKDGFEEANLQKIDKC